MRTDVTIDRKQVRCPHASTLGYGQWIARTGDLVCWQQPLTDSSSEPCTGRVIGRIAYAPPCGETPAIRGWLLVLALSPCLTHAFERWVNPEWVTEVYRVTPDVAAWLTSFFSPALIKRSADDLRRAAEYGAMGANLRPDDPEWDHAFALQRYDAMRDRQRQAAEEVTRG